MIEVISPNQLNQALYMYDQQHENLRLVFKEFCEGVKTEMGGDGPRMPRLPGLKADIDGPALALTFAGRSIKLVFSSELDETGKKLVGVITGYLCKELPEDEHKAIERITFDRHGETDILIDGDKVSIDTYPAAFYVALLMIHAGMNVE